LVAWTNWYVVGAGALGMVFYVIVYGWAKRVSSHGTLVGTISGSLPLVAGYLAARNRIDSGAILLFLAMTAWQMPHFYAIALRRAEEYRAAGIPVLPVVKGIRRTKLEIIVYVFLFTMLMVSLSLEGLTGAIYLLVMGPLSLYWLWRGVAGFSHTDDKAWGGRMFGLSLVVLLTWSVMLAVGSVLP
jgi:protoheme IX farnesyltransferase